MRQMLRSTTQGFLGILVLAVLWAPGLGAQDTGTVQGQVTAAQSDRPLEGVQVFVAGTGIGGLTNDAGRYVLLNVPAGTVTLLTQMIGYGQGERQVTVQAGQSVTADFVLEQSAIQLDEVVVTGQGRARERRQLSTTVDVINAQDIATASVQSVDELLRGRISGATISATSAQPGTGSTINFRGVSSVFGSQTPVIYVDGVRVDNTDEIGPYTGGEYSSALAELLVSDIERVEITKGGAASTLYGSDAASGVIQIFTKKGSPGAPRTTFRIEQGFDQPELKYMLDTGLIYPDIAEEGGPTSFLKDNFFETGHFQNYHLGVSGGTSDLTYNVSGRIQQSDGVQPKNTSEVYNLRGGVQASVTEDLRLDFSGAYTRTNFGRLYNGDAINDPLTSFEVGDVFFFTGVSRSPDNFGLAADIFLLPDIDERVNRFNFSSGASYRISDLLTTRATVGIDYRQNQQRIFEPIGFTVGEVTGALTRFDRDFTSVTLDVAGTLAYPQEGDVTSTLTFGAQGFRDELSTISGSGTTFALPGSPDFDQAASIIANENNQELFNGGFYLEEQVGLWDQLFLNAGVRFDFNSTFGEEVDFEMYPKVGASYLLSDAGFWDPAREYVGNLKVRVAYGETGKFPEPFLRDRTFSASPFRGESAPQFDNPGNPDLTAEVTSTVEAGFDLGAFDDRLGIGFTWYDATTDDALLFVPEDPATGQGTQLRNVGEINNRGIELDVNALLINRPDIQWSLGATYQTVENEVVDMGTASSFNVDTQKRVAEGHPLGEWYIRTPFDSDGDGFMDGDSLAFQGSTPYPLESGSFSTDLRLYDRLTLTAMADWARDFSAYDWGSRWAVFNNIARRELVDDEFEFPRFLTSDGDAVLYGGAINAYLVEGDYLKLREISARYAVPSTYVSGFGADRASVWVSVRNVAIWSANPMIDPELNGLQGGGNLSLGGESSITLSPPRQFRLGVEVTF